MSELVCKSIILEVRPRLQSVNVFINFNINPESFNVQLDKELVLLILGKETVKIPCKNIDILCNSLSSVKIINKSGSFRFLTNNSLETLGTFKTEFLKNTVASMESLDNKPLLSKGISYTINCSNCKKVLSNIMEFERVLPLPSDGSDSSDWFCHNHGNDANVTLDPKENEVFYSQSFVHINKKTIPHLRFNKKILACKFCLQWLGSVHNNNTIKLWFNTVIFSSNKDRIYTLSLQDSYKTIKNSFKYSFHNSSKLLLYCHTSVKHTDTLLLWILEKKLQILFGQTDVQKYDVSKVLFKFVQNDNSIIDQWRNDSFVSVIEISKPMMVELLNELHRCNKLIPLEYSKSNDFKVSYLFMYDH